MTYQRPFPIAAARFPAKLFKAVAENQPTIKNRNER
jgi:hypothetical protein